MRQTRDSDIRRNNESFAGLTIILKTELEKAVAFHVVVNGILLVMSTLVLSSQVVLLIIWLTNGVHVFYLLPSTADDELCSNALMTIFPVISIRSRDLLFYFGWVFVFSRAVEAELSDPWCHVTMDVTIGHNLRNI